MPLSQDDINGCREAFNKFDKDGSGTVRVAENCQIGNSSVDRFRTLFQLSVEPFGTLSSLVHCF